MDLNGDISPPPREAYPQEVVDTAVRPPALPPSASTTTRRPRRRWLWWLIAALLVIVVAAVTTGIVLVANYQPFVPGYKQYYGLPAVEGTESTSFSWIGAPPNLRVIKVPTEPDMTFRYRFSIWNHGPVPVTVTRFGIPSWEQESDLKIVPVAIDPSTYGGGGFIQVQPIRLAPRQQMGIDMEVTVARCMSGVSWNAIPITFDMYGIEKHVVAPANVQIELVRSQDCG
jgi:hypothetical protein